MEIRDYLRAIRRWLWLPIALPLIAGLLTGAVLELQPSQYQANATVIVPAVSAKGFSTSAAAQYFDTFKDVLVSSPVVNRVAADNHVPTQDLVKGLTANTATASSNVIQVTYDGYKGQNTSAIVRDATVVSLDTMAQPQVVEAENAVTAADAQLQQAQNAVNAFEASTGQVLPQQQFNNEQQELNSLLLQLQQANIANDTARATALQTIITQREQQLSALGQQVNQYTSLSNALTAAMATRDHASQELNDANALISSNHDPSTVAVTDVGRLSKLSNTLRFSGIAVAVALILALAFILIMELMRGGRPQAVSATPEASAGTWPEADEAEEAENEALAANGSGLAYLNAHAGGNGRRSAMTAQPDRETLSVPQRGA